MSDGERNIGKWLDPGPELLSYDPAWEARWDATDTLFRIMRKHSPGGGSDLSARLVAELCQAAEAKVRFPCDLEAHLATRTASSAHALPGLLAIEELRRGGAFPGARGRSQSLRPDQARRDRHPKARRAPDRPRDAGHGRRTQGGAAPVSSDVKLMAVRALLRIAHRPGGGTQRGHVYPRGGRARDGARAVPLVNMLTLVTGAGGQDRLIGHGRDGSRC